MQTPGPEQQVSHLQKGSNHSWYGTINHEYFIVKVLLDSLTYAESNARKHTHTIKIIYPTNILDMKYS